MGVSLGELGSESKWFCEECTEGRHTCFSCGEQGDDFLEVNKCESAKCGKYFHYKCLIQYKDFKLIQEPKELSTNNRPKPLSNNESGLYTKSDYEYDFSPSRSKRQASNISNGPFSHTKTANDGGDLVNRISSSPTNVSCSSEATARGNSKNGGNHMNGSKAPPSAAVMAAWDRLNSQKDGTRQHAKALKEYEHAKERQEEQLKIALESAFRFKCPQHFCCVCDEFYSKYSCKERSKDRKLQRSDKLIKCVRCPKAYHKDCVEPGTRYNLECLLCPDHPTVPLLTYSHSYSSQDAICGGFVQMWDELGIPEDAPDSSFLFDLRHFRLPLQFKTEVGKHPPVFKVLRALDYDTLPLGEKSMPFHTPDSECECESEVCGDRCLNRLLKIECCEMGGKGTSRSICAVGPECTNRQFQQRNYAKCLEFQEYGMGWGLKTLEPVAAGTLVIEYLGEVINTEEMQRRMQNQRQYTPNDHDFYIMELENGFYVDGKLKGNASRFINHSCDPNCELVRWIVKGRMRIGIFAIRYIADGEPLSYDYQFDTHEADAFKCACGTKKCRGTMAPKKKDNTDMTDRDKNTLTKEEKQKLIAAGKLRQKRLAEQLVIDEAKRSLTSKTLPGDSVHHISAGPLKFTFKAARAGNIFLPRNAKKCVDFILRRELLYEKSCPAKISSTASSSASSSSH